MNHEHAVIGAVLSDNDVFWSLDLKPDDFENPDHAKIWAVVSRVMGEGFPADPVTLCEQDDSLDLSYLSQLAVECPATKNATAYAKLVREHATDRKARKVLSEALTSGFTLAELLADLEGMVSSESDMKLTDAVKAAIESSEQAAKREGAEIVTGIGSLDRSVVLGAGKLVIVAARPSIGKTAMVWQWLLHNALRDRPVGMVSLEMDADELGARAISNKFQVDGLDIIRGKALEQIRNVKMDYPVWLDFRSDDLSSIIARATEWKHRHGIQAFVVDYLQLIDTEGESRNAELGRITRSLKKLARRLGIPVILLCQLNRALEKTGRKPMLVDLRDSGEIEQDADIVIALHSDLAEQDATKGSVRRVEIGVLKNRAGRVGWASETVMFHGSIQTFMEMDGRAA